MSQLKVVLLGIVGHGKTSLFNKLTLANKPAKYGGKSLTKQIVIGYAAYGQFEIVDTPGFDANEDKLLHSAGVIAALAYGDVNRILVVVQCQRIDQMIKFFLKIQDLFRDSEIQSQLVFHIGIYKRKTYRNILRIQNINKNKNQKQNRKLNQKLKRILIFVQLFIRHQMMALKLPLKRLQILFFNQDLLKFNYMNLKYISKMDSSKIMKIIKQQINKNHSDVGKQLHGKNYLLQANHCYQNYQHLNQLIILMIKNNYYKMKLLILQKNWKKHIKIL
ncbi:unnamed protein product [Paramecium sonneborni]|uniref:G domain-containing protein n=1 Tax=Paramecium sonneborni TaxID=65129 RepID=A0A8S1RUC5_9CILI|nr:unnamed protein product [Paramecium sonneborni]